MQSSATPYYGPIDHPVCVIMVPLRAKRNVYNHAEISARESY